jgi:hypothetical protein
MKVKSLTELTDYLGMINHMICLGNLDKKVAERLIIEAHNSYFKGRFVSK